MCVQNICPHPQSYPQKKANKKNVMVLDPYPTNWEHVPWTPTILSSLCQGWTYTLLHHSELPGSRHHMWIHLVHVQWWWHTSHSLSILMSEVVILKQHGVFQRFAPVRQSHGAALHNPWQDAYYLANKISFAKGESQQLFEMEVQQFNFMTEKLLQNSMGRLHMESAWIWSIS